MLDRPVPSDHHPTKCFGPLGEPGARCKVVQAHPSRRMGDRTALATGGDDDLCHHDRCPPARASRSALALVRAGEWVALPARRLPGSLADCLYPESGVEHPGGDDTQWAPTGAQEMAQPVDDAGCAFEDRSSSAVGCLLAGPC